ncbi:hypothetical protein DMENIID0001_136850 [Sergentomyia squamirostris]
MSLQPPKVNREIKRRRLLRYKRRWTADEESKILDYLIETKDCARMSSRLYFEQLLARHQWDIDVDLVKQKACNIRSSYIKHLTWKRNAIESGRYTSDEIKHHMRNRCPNEKKFAILMADDEQVKKLTAPQNHKVEDLDVNTDDLNLDVSAPENETFQEFKVEMNDDPDLPDLSWFQTSNNTTNSLSSTHTETSDPLRDLDARENPENLEMKKERMSLMWMKLEIEKEKITMEREKIALQREQIQIDHKYKILQLEQQERLKKLHIEKDAELKTYELQLKFRVNKKSEM